MLGILGIFTHVRLINFTKSIAGRCSGDLFYVINFNYTIVILGETPSCICAFST